MRSTKIENVRPGVQFAFGGYADAPTGKREVAVVTRQTSGIMALHVGTGKAQRSTEVRRDQRIMVDYDTDGLAIRACRKHPEHGPYTAYPSGSLYCKPCHDGHLAASKARCKARKQAGQVRPSTVEQAAAARRAKAEAKVDRLMAMLAASPRTIPSVYRERDEVA